MIAHRGGPDYDTYEYARKKPLDYDIWESSKTAYKRAVEQGAKAIEMDVQLTKDNEIIILHDDTLNRTTNAQGFVSNYTTEQLNKEVFTNKDYSETLPTLKWVFEEFKDNDVIYIIEVKNIKNKTKLHIFCQKLKKLITKYQLANRCNIISFYPKILRTISKYLPKVSKGLLVTTTNRISSFFKNFAFLFGVDTISFNYDGLNSNIVDKCRQAGFKIAVWTVNNKEDLKKMKNILKVDYITSDFLYY